MIKKFEYGISLLPEGVITHHIVFTDVICAHIADEGLYQSYQLYAQHSMWSIMELNAMT